MKSVKKSKSAASEANKNGTKQNRTRAVQAKQMALLRYSFNQIFAVGKFGCLKNELKTSDPLLNTIGLDGIEQKFDEDSYTQFQEYIDDIDQLVKSYMVHAPSDANIQEAVQSLWEQCQRDVKSIKACPDCFKFWMDDHDDYFTRVCSVPHLLIFAKMRGYPKWPSKLMSVNGNKANVEFFGDHTQNDVPLSNCFLYSSEIHRRSPKANDELMKANEELQLHIENIKHKYGEFCPAVGNVVLTDCDLEQEQMKMFPGAFKKKTNASNDSDEQSSSSDEVEQADDSDDDNESNGKATNRAEEIDDNEDDELESSADVLLHELARDIAAARNHPNSEVAKQSMENEELRRLGESLESATKAIASTSHASKQSSAGTEDNETSSDEETEDEDDDLVEVDKIPPKRTSAVSIMSGTATNKGRAAPVAVEDDIELVASDDDVQKTDASRKRRDDATEKEKASQSAPKKRLRFSNVVHIVSSNGDAAQENIPSASVSMEKLKRLKTLKETMRSCEKEIQELEREIIITKNKPTCATCKTALDGPFFCSTQCQNNHE